MPVLTPAPIDFSSPREAAPAEPTGPVCSLQRSGSLWQLGIEAQELTAAIGQLAEQLEADDEDPVPRHWQSLRPPCSQKKGTSRPSPPRLTPPAG